jgi:hypothetical protein
MTCTRAKRTVHSVCHSNDSEGSVHPKEKKVPNGEACYGFDRLA